MNDFLHMNLEDKLMCAGAHVHNESYGLAILTELSIETGCISVNWHLLSTLGPALAYAAQVMMSSSPIRQSS